MKKQCTILSLMFISGLFASALVPFSVFAAGTGTLVITTQDTAKKQVTAPISVDNVQQGTGKVTVTVTAGTHEVKFGDLTGYSIVSPRSGKKTVTVKTGKKTSVAATYKKSSSGGGGTTGGVVAGPQVTDIEGNVYNSVVIGTQTWMKENLKVTKYNDGAAIPTTTLATLNVTSETAPQYQWAYDGKESNVSTYGRLYTWYAATDSRGVCPTGWQVPTDAEWTTLGTYLGGVNVAGGKMKEAGTTHCNSSPYPGYGTDNNSSGFTALPGGYRYNDGTFHSVGSNGYWWSTTDVYTTFAWTYSTDCLSSGLVRDYSSMGNGSSVRCIKSSSGGGGTTGGVVAGPQATDFDGNVYNSVVIGTQTWMKENLKVTKYRDGTAIGTTTTADISNETSPAYQWAYEGNESNVAVYGRLYTWNAANSSLVLCPSGWHMPTKDEWTTLTDYLGGASAAGVKMKETGLTHWWQNHFADNSSGFTGLPGGFRSGNLSSSNFQNIRFVSQWWSATDDTNSAGTRPSAWYISLYYGDGNADINLSSKKDGMSVRCVKD